MSKDFRRHDSHKLKRLSQSWRKPRGLDNKVRLEKRGYVKKVRVGFGTPGKETPTLVSSKTELLTFKKSDKIILSATLGQKKKLELIALAKEKGIIIANVSDSYVSDVEAKMKGKKTLADKKKQAREEKKKAAQAKSSKKDSKLESKVDSPKDTEEAKAQEKKEKDKILTKKDSM